jgi:hypothetical protein
LQVLSKNDKLSLVLYILFLLLVTFTITPPGENALHFSADALAEWSSRYSIPLPLIENSAELLPPAPALVQPIPANAGPDDESSDDDEPVWQIKDHAMRK